MTMKGYPYDPSKINPVDAQNDGFLFTSDGQAVRLSVEKRPDPEAVEDIDLAELERWLYGDGEPEPEAEPGIIHTRYGPYHNTKPDPDLPMPVTRFVSERPDFRDVLRARLKGGADLVYEPDPERPTFAQFLQRR